MTALDEGVVEEVEAALPRGEVYELPEEWRLALADVSPRKESPTSISSFLTCPLKWYMERHSPLPRTREASIYGVVGTFVHRVLEVFYSEPARLRTEELLKTTFRVAWDALKSSNDEDGIVAPDLIREFRELEVAAPDAVEFRRSFHGRAERSIGNVLDFDPDPSRVRIVSNEEWVRATVDGVLIRGKIDRIVRASDGREEVEDWKTGRAPRSEGPPSVLDVPYVPVGLYAWMRTLMTEHDISPAEVGVVRLLFLSDLKRVSIRITPRVIETVDLLVHRVVAEMNAVSLTGKITASPASAPDEGQCRYCPVSGECPAWTGGTFETIRVRNGV